MKILAEEATVHTACVEIKALTISGKQVTLALFRQFPEFPAFDENYSPKGRLWGWVNYCPGEKHCDFERQHHGRGHLHLIWEWDGFLFRCAVSAKAVDWEIEERQSELAQWERLYGRGGIGKHSGGTKEEAAQRVEALRSISREYAARIEALPQLFIAV